MAEKQALFSLNHITWWFAFWNIKALFVLTHINIKMLQNNQDWTADRQWDKKNRSGGCPPPIGLSFYLTGHKYAVWHPVNPSDPAPDSDSIISLQVTGTPINLSDVTLDGQLHVCIQQLQQDRGEVFPSYKDLLTYAECVLFSMAFCFIIIYDWQCWTKYVSFYLHSLAEVAVSHTSHCSENQVSQVESLL